MTTACDGNNRHEAALGPAIMARFQVGTFQAE